MPVPAGAGGATLYTDTATVKSAIGKTSADDRDDLIDAAIAAACRQIDQRCGRYFYIDNAATSRTFRARGNVTYDGLDELIYVDDIATSVGLVVETSAGVGGTWSTVSAASYELGPDNADAYGRPWTEVRGSAGWLSCTAKVRITATWGWPAVPDEITQAATLLAARLYRRKDSPEGVLGSAEWGTVRVSRVDPDVEALISAYVIPVLA